MKHPMFGRLSAILLAILLTCGAAPVSANPSYSTNNIPYNDNFRDVTKSDWFYDSVAQAYSMGIISGVSNTEYAPSQSLDLAACIKLACCVHQLKNNGTITLGNGSVNWYDTYVSYALQHGILSEAYNDYTVPASRAQIAVIFSRVLAKDEPQINAEAAKNNPLADVTDPSLWYYSSVYKMYVWGIMTGDDLGNFNPEGKIKRSEIAAVVVRMLDNSRRIDVSAKNDAPAQTPTTPNVPENDPVPGTDPILLHRGGTKDIPFTGLTGFSILWSNGSTSGYSTDCINDVVLSADSLTFCLRKNVGLAAMGIVRGWLNNAALTVNGSPAAQAAEEAKAILDGHLALFINGRAVELTSLSLSTADGNAEYTITFANTYDMSAVSHAALICGELPTAERNTADNAIAQAANGSDANIGDTETETESYSNYASAVSAVRREGSTIHFEHHTDRLSVFYTDLDGVYRLRFVYRDGSVQVIASEELTSIRVNDAGTVLYYALPTPDGNSIEYGVNIGTSSSDDTSDSSKPDTTEKKDLKGVLRGLSITLSGEDKSLIALMEGEDNVQFMGVYSNYEIAFSVVTIAPKEYFSVYNNYFGTNSKNRIFALKDGIYYALLYEGEPTKRLCTAAERVVSSVVTENPFDCVYTPFDVAPDPTDCIFLYLKDTYEKSFVGDPFLWINDSTADNGYRIDNAQEATESYRVTDETEVYVLAMDHAPQLRTTYREFCRIWPLGSRWDIWRAVVDPSTGVVTTLIQQYVP